MADTAEEPGEGGTRLIQMRLRERTMEQLGSLHMQTGIGNRTQIVAGAINLTHFLCSARDSGSKIIVEHKDGTRETVLILGL